MSYTAYIFSHNTTFKAVDYNMKKVDTGAADLLTVKNFDALRCIEYPTASDYKSYFQAIARSNNEIRQRQLHASLGAEGKLVATSELARTAEQWLQQMGYGRQPYLIFAHYDALHAHVHMVSSRVTATGKLINNSLEKLRAGQVLEKIRGIDISKRIEEDCKDALAYRFKTIEQLSALLEAKGYFVQQKEGYLHIYYRRMSHHRIPVELVSKLTRDYMLDSKRLIIIRNLFEINKQQISPGLYQRNHYLVQRHRSKFDGWHSKMVAFLEDSLDIKIVFKNKEDELPYSYLIIDRKNKHIYDGEDLMPLAEFIEEQPYCSKTRQLENSDNISETFKPHSNKRQRQTQDILSPQPFHEREQDLRQ